VGEHQGTRRAPFRAFHSPSPPSLCLTILFARMHATVVMATIADRAKLHGCQHSMVSPCSLCLFHRRVAMRVRHRPELLAESAQRRQACGHRTKGLCCGSSPGHRCPAQPKPLPGVGVACHSRASVTLGCRR
jgi:hypothetical protein